MKYLVRLFVVTFFFLVSTHAFAEQKIVVLDLKYVLNNSKAGKGAQDFLKKLFNDNAKKFTKLEKDLKNQESELLGKKTILSKEDYKKKGEALRKKVVSYQNSRRKSLDEITTKRAKSRETLIAKIEPIVDEYINKNSISIVIDKKNMIGGLNEYDITKDIIKQLNKELPSLNLK
jgi:Skp family chaperone for outer membrane proteins